MPDRSKVRTRRHVASGRPAGVRGERRASPLTPAEQELLRGHVINLHNGNLSGGGVFQTTEQDVARLLGELLPAEVALRRASGERARLLFYAHGGLVDEREGLDAVLARLPFWRANRIYPVCFVWETGLRESLADVFRRARRAAGAARRGPGLDTVIERLARPLGLPLWTQMKRSAGRAAAPGGGTALVAQATRALWDTSHDALEIHAAGHSAGSVFLAAFLPTLLETPPAGRRRRPLHVRTAHLLAPAITTNHFHATLHPLVGPARAIRSLVMYTMRESLERRDPSLRPYSRSLLYLVSRAFESEAPTPLLGLEESVRQDPELVECFGLDGRQGPAMALWATTADDAAPRDRTQSTTHAGFDDDPATLESLVRRVLELPDDEPIAGLGAGPAGTQATSPARTPASTRARASRPVHTRGTTARRPADRPRAVTPWTVLVWIAGDNDLERFGLKDLEEMKRVGSTDEVNIVAQFDSMSDDRTRRYYLRRRTTVEQDVVSVLDETNTGDPAVATDFFVWGLTEYPSDRVLAVIWNHGSGIDETDVYRRAAARGLSVERHATRSGKRIPRSHVRTMLATRFRRAIFGTTLDEAMQDRGIAYDDTARDFLDTAELQRMLADVTRMTGRTIDLLGFDACLMNMVEIAYQVRRSTGLIVASEEVEPGDGWPYHRVLADLAARPAMSAADLGEVIVRRYVAAYGSESVTMSVVDTARAPDIASRVDALAVALTTALKSVPEFAAITRAMNAAQRFDMDEFVDLGDFCRELLRRSKADSVRALAQATLDGLPGLVLSEAHKGSGVSDSHGIAIYLPRATPSRVYGRLEFSKDTHWDDFIRAYHHG